MDTKRIPTDARQSGFGLVELMVGMAVAMVGMIVIMQVYSVFEGQKRTTTSGGDAQTNGALALYTMEREIRAAGNGLTEGEPQKYAPLAGCATHVYDSGGSYLMPNATAPFESTVRSAGTVSTLRLAPAVVSDGGGGNPDAVTIVYGSTVIAAPYTLATSYTPGGPSIGLTSAAGIGQGDMVALIERNPALTTNVNFIVPKTCSLLQVSGAPTGGSVPVATGRYNKSGGTGLPLFTDEARLFNLGRLSVVTYRIDANRDLVADITQFGVIPNGGAGTPVTNRTDRTPIASGIVNMQVQYGIDSGNPMGTIQSECKTQSPGVSIQATDPDAIVDAWVNATGQWANDGANSPTLLDLRRIRAVRIGLVARSSLMEKPDSDGVCRTTTAAPVIRWDSGPDMTPDLSGDPNWQCYRYKTFQAVIPVRNALWSSTMNPASAATCGWRDPS